MLKGFQKIQNKIEMISKIRGLMDECKRAGRFTEAEK
jgi:hypothetical protein